MKYSSRNKILAGGVVLFVLCAVWFFATRGQSTRGDLIFPRPVLLLRTLRDQWQEILQYSLTTWYRVMVGLVIGSFFGILAGILMTWNRVLYYLLDPVIEIIRPIPPIALTPFFILWMGLGDVSQLLLISLGCFMIITVSTFVGILNVNPVYVRAAQSLGANKTRIYRTVYIPAIIPGLLSGIRVALASGFALTVAAEYLGAQGGLGFLIRNARTILHTETILLAAILLGIESLVTDQLLRLLFRKITKWTPSKIS
ncbi:MAG TPA: ABC transporter permease [Puia sp.]|jgi:ABC-type nitrate/sulfonate/bicarbonate transport system permease component